MKPTFKKILLQFNLLLLVCTLFVTVSGQTNGSLNRVCLQTGSVISTHKGADIDAGLKTISRQKGSPAFDYKNNAFAVKPVFDQRSIEQQDYLKKSKAQKKTARILLAGGAILIATAFIIPRGDLVEDGICIGIYCSDKYKNDGIKTALLLTGAGSALISIPFLLHQKKINEEP